MSAAKAKAPKTKTINVKLRVRLYDLEAKEEVNLNPFKPVRAYGQRHVKRLEDSEYVRDVGAWMYNQFEQGGYYADYFKCLKKSGGKYAREVHIAPYYKDGAVLSAKYKYIVDGSCGYLGTEEEGINMLDVPQKQIKLLNGDGKNYVLLIEASELINKTAAQKKQAAEALKKAKKQAADALKKAKKQAADALKKAKKQGAAGGKKSVLAAFYHIGWPAGVNQKTEEVSHIPVTTDAAAKKLKTELDSVYKKIQKHTDLLKWTITKTKYRDSDKAIIFKITYVSNELESADMVNDRSSSDYVNIPEFDDIEGVIYNH
jgi:hypothetical protein